MPKSDFGKSPKSFKGEKSPSISRSAEKKKAQEVSAVTSDRNQKERKNESRFEYIMDKNNRRIKVDKIKKTESSFKGKQKTSPKTRSPPAEDAGNPADPENVDAARMTELITSLHDADLEAKEIALVSLVRKLSTNYSPGSLQEWTLTMGSVLADIIGRGETKTASLAARVAALMCAQAGRSHEAGLGRMYKEYLRPILLTKLQDESADSSLRALCAEAIGVSELIAINDPTMNKDTLDVLLQLALNPSDGKGKDVSPEDATTVHVAALRSWCLILTANSSKLISKDDFITRFSQFQGLLKSPSAELRVASGNAMAFLSEIATQSGTVLTPTPELYDTFRDLMRDIQSEAKHEQQKTFREIIKTFKDGTPFTSEIKINTEVLYIDSWTDKLKYEAFVRILRHGINTHLQRNSLLRRVFNIDSPLLDSNSESSRRRGE